MKIDEQLLQNRASQPYTVAVIGGGWYGSHIAAALAQRRYAVTLFEGGDAIFTGISGKFGIRIHVGPHYPRSRATRKSCQTGFNEFMQTYPSLANEHEYAVYALGLTDAQGLPSKVSKETFSAVCREFSYKGEVDLQSWGYNPKEVQIAFDFREPSAVLGPRLRAFFQDYLPESGVDVKCNVRVLGITKQGNKLLVQTSSYTQPFDHVVNTTSYKDLLPIPRPLPFDMETIYQPCLALIYRDKTPGEKPISFIVMDGWYPCLMPYDDRESTSMPVSKYIMTHGKWTIMCSHEDLSSALRALAVIDDDFVRENVQKRSEEHMLSFWPGFSDRFEYQGWTGEVLAKLKTQKEFRSGFAIQCKASGVISVFPGKITNIFDAERDTLALMDRLDVLETDHYTYVQDSVLHHASDEVVNKPLGDGRSTAELQTFRDILSRLSAVNSENPKERRDGVLVAPPLMTRGNLHASAQAIWDYLWQQPRHVKVGAAFCFIAVGMAVYSRFSSPEGSISTVAKYGIFGKSGVVDTQTAHSSNNFVWTNLRM